LNEQIETVSRIYSDIYSHGEEVDNLIRILSFHPNFLNEFMKFHNYLMYSQGPLSYDLRHYVAIMAAARHKCMFLVAQQEREFKLQNGQKSWLNGINNIPQKLKDLNEINKLLCHQPWLINHSHIEKVLTGQYSWSLTELIMAITITAHFNALSGFVFGLGINENYMQQLEQEEIFKKKLEAEKAAAQALKDSWRTSSKKKKRNGEHNGSEFPTDTNNTDDYDDEDDNEDEDDDDDDDEEYIDDNEEERQSYDNLNWTNRGRQFNRNDTHARSDSTGTANRTLSNSSTSSCELGIDMLLKEMQMMSEKTNLMKATSSLLSSSLSQIQSSGSNTITNSPITNLNGQIQYLSDLSNYKSFHNTYNHNHHLNSHNHNFQYRNHDNEQSENENSSSTNNHVGNANASHFDEIESEPDESEIDEHESDSNNNRLKSINKMNKLKSKSNTKLNSSLPSSIQSAATNNINNKQHQPVTCTNNINTTSNNQNNNDNNLISTPSSIMTSVINQSNKHMLKFTFDPDFAYLNFKKADQSLKLEYYTWENQGYITAYSIYPDICELLDKNFKIAVNMTYNT